MLKKQDPAIDKMNEKQWKAALKKLHEQFAHLLHDKLKGLIVVAGQWKEPIGDILKKIETDRSK